jgi:hypothetical protein
MGIGLVLSLLSTSLPPTLEDLRSLVLTSKDSQRLLRSDVLAPCIPRLSPLASHYSDVSASS